MTQFNLTLTPKSLKPKQSLIKLALTKIKVFQHRTTNRQALKELPDYLLQDMGISRREAIKESRKPFWKK